MSEMFIGDYIAEARRAMKNPVLQSALADLQKRFGLGTALAYQMLPEGPDLRLRAHEIREKAIANLDVLLETLAATSGKKAAMCFLPAMPTLPFIIVWKLRTGTKPKQPSRANPWSVRKSDSTPR